MEITHLDVIFLQEAMVSGSREREVLGNILREWHMCSIDAEGKSSDLLST